MYAADETFTFEVRMSSASSASFFCDNKNIGETTRQGVGCVINHPCCFL